MRTELPSGNSVAWFQPACLCVAAAGAVPAPHGFPRLEIRYAQFARANCAPRRGGNLRADKPVRFFARQKTAHGNPRGFAFGKTAACRLCAMGL
jgi:hypothetical protein